MAKGFGNGSKGMKSGSYDVNMPQGKGKGKAPAQTSTKVQPKKKR